VKGDENTMRVVVQRLTGSPDLFRNLTRDPSRSINFITCHDGFTLNDLVSYNHKHNLANGENNRDGHNHNLSWNHGVEGVTDDNAIEELRLRQIKNFFTLLFFAQGTPMIYMGDEVRRTQMGNNNAYCQDNEIGWFDWSLVEKNQDLFRFVMQLIRFNLGTDFFQEKCFWNLPDELKTTFELHGVKLGQVSWEKNTHAFSFTLFNPDYGKALHVMINAYWQPLTFEVPELTTEKWRLLIDTSNPSPDDFYSVKKDPIIQEQSYKLKGRSIVVLFVYMNV
jgi:glycogen operon protein